MSTAGMKRSYELESGSGDQSPSPEGDFGNAITCNEQLCKDEVVPLHLYPTHVEAYHNNTCEECKGNFASDYMLEIHIDECHNPFHGPRFHCFESECGDMFSSHGGRVKHLKERHYYPDQYDYEIIYKGA